MRATISTTIALLVGLALACPAATAQDLKSSQHQETAADATHPHGPTITEKTRRCVGLYFIPCELSK